MLTITLQAGGYEATFAPANGGACISLQKGDLHLFHQWNKTEEVEAHPTSYGLPCLFPPNRIDGGRFVLKEWRVRFRSMSRIGTILCMVFCISGPGR